MKKLIFLIQEYLDVKEEKLNKASAEVARQKLFSQSVKVFKDQMKDLFAAKAFKIVREMPPNAVIVEYADIMNEKMYEALRAADIVEIINSII